MRRSFSTTRCLVAFAFLLVMGNIGFAERIIYVDDDANGLNDGTSWQNAYNYPQDALADANSSTKPNVIASERSERGNLNTIIEIRVAQGIYRPDETSAEPNGTGDREATFQLINGVTFKGGYAGLSQPEPNERDVGKYETILSGHLNGTDSYHVVTGSGTDANAVLDGFTITGGSDGGMFNDHGSPTVTNCIFSRNSGRYGCVYNHYGNPIFVNCIFREGRACASGGMYNRYSSPMLTDCTFSENVAYFEFCSEGGGGMYNLYSNLILTNCTFRKNSAGTRGGRYGGGMLNRYSNVTMEKCTFTENSGFPCGGMCNGDNSTTKLTDCTFSRNSGYSGGGIYNGEIYDGQSTLTLNNCIFSENSAMAGGGVYNTSNSITVINCSFIGNLAYASGNEYGYGGGMYTYALVNATIINCTFSQNLAEHSGGGMYAIGEPTVNNCIFSGNSAVEYGGGICCQPGRLTLANCTFAGNSAKNGRALACKGGFVSIVEVQGTNCILWDGGDEIFIDPSKIDITYSDIQGGWPGEGNIDKDPCFAKPGYWDPNGTSQDPNDDFWVDGDYHLKSQAGRWDADDGRWTKDELTSLCIDAGDPASPIGLEPFPNGGIINMGAYGGTVEASKSYFGQPVCETIVAGDINGDCIVNLNDFALMAFHWLEEN